MEAKLTIISDKKFYHKVVYIASGSDDKIKKYILSLVEPLQGTGEFTALLLEFNGKYFYYNNLIETTCFVNGTLPEIIHLIATPAILYYHKAGDKPEGEYEELEIILDFPVFKQFVPLTTPKKAKEFIKFLIDDLNINFHPDDDFKNYLDRMSCITVTLPNGEKKRTYFDDFTVQYFEALVGESYQLLGDEIYEYGMALIKLKIK